MSESKIRLTTPTRLVLDVLMASSADDPVWGYRICELSGLGSGTVYPILERLEEAGWIEGKWEAEGPDDRPRRRFYEVTGTGRQEYADAKAEAIRRKRRWLPAALLH
ncbi:PadR family transcriptional regulator [Thermoactinospora rubra]|uniref:PadR family transcriptional regulator n=1 Tax=Thermoactinospora rubra TaxID=1088767 RepID=UPI000A0FBF6E|nr:helix-turn-helix transcriptional regulator [Thermoactinospora rubra]